MRLGINSFLLSSGFTNADLPMIRQFHDWGADVIELAVVQPEHLDVSQLKQALQESGMANVPLCGAYTPERDLRGTEIQQRACLEYMERMIALAESIGSSMIAGPMYSATGRCALQTPQEKEDQAELVAGHMSSLCKRAADAGVTLAIEPLNRFETDMVNTLDQAAALIERTGADNLKIHVDTFHMHIEEDDPVSAMRKHAGLIGHFHASASHRGIPGRDQIDWPAICNELKDTEYDGDIVVETFALENDVIARAASIWFQRFETAEGLGRESMQYLRKLIQ